MTNNTTADLDRDIAHLIDNSENGIARVPRETLARLRALLTSPRAAVPGQGWKLVPEIPTVEMLDAALPGDDTFGRGFKTRIYQEMLDAAPAAPAAPVEDVAPNVVEAIAEQWDGCMYAAPGIDIDIGEAIRAAAKRLDTAPAAPVAEPASQGVIAAALAVIECDRAQVLTDAHIDALDNAIKIQRGDAELPVAAQAVAADGDATDQGVAKAQSEFVSALILAICELPDRSSPEGEPGAMVANSDEIAHCVDVALEKTGLSISRRAAVSPATADEPAALDPAVLAVVESLSDANQPGNIKAQISYLMARVREDVLTHDGKMGGNTVLAENRLHALIGLAIRGARASQTAAPQANVAGERAAFVEKLRELGADISPLGSRDERLCITSNIMVDDVLAAARASQAAAPADAQGGQKFDMRTALSTAKLRIEQRSDDEQDGEYWSAAQSILAVMKLLDDMPGFFADAAAAPAEAREPVGDWLWRELMDYCRERGVAPANNDRLFEMVKRARKQFDSCAPADAGDAVAIGFRTRIPGFDWVPWLTDNQETIRKAIADALAIGSEASKLYSGPVQGAQGGKGGEA
ncbi:hypothetical protein [Burkholderia gladioli]|nr:hypothetical protein [Burkholderia gladioli]ATF84598.1 hypothetical protein CO712_05715 [Burkholderia gladioli pv. gladioli]